MKLNCPNSDKNPTCVRCRGDHSHVNSHVKDPASFRCVNCSGNHPSCSKQCQAIISEINRKKTLIEAKAKKTSQSEFTRTYSTWDGAHSSKVNTNANLANLTKSFLNLLIVTIKYFNQVTESIEENLQFFANLVSQNVGKYYGNFVLNTFTPMKY